MARLGGTPVDLTASGNTTLDSTATARSGRVRVYNADTVQHIYTFTLGGKALKKSTLQPGEDTTFGPENAASGKDFVVNTAEATTTTASKATFTGEDDS